MPRLVAEEKSALECFVSHATAAGNRAAAAINTVGKTDGEVRLVMKQPGVEGHSFSAAFDLVQQRKGLARILGAWRKVAKVAINSWSNEVKGPKREEGCVVEAKIYPAGGRYSDLTRITVTDVTEICAVVPRTLSDKLATAVLDGADQGKLGIRRARVREGAKCAR